MMKALSTAMSQGDLELAKKRLKSSMEDMRQHVKVRCRLCLFRGCAWRVCRVF